MKIYRVGNGVSSSKKIMGRVYFTSDEDVYLLGESGLLIESFDYQDIYGVFRYFDRYLLIKEMKITDVLSCVDLITGEKYTLSYEEADLLARGDFQGGKIIGRKSKGRRNNWLFVYDATDKTVATLDVDEFPCAIESDIYTFGIANKSVKKYNIDLQEEWSFKHEKSVTTDCFRYPQRFDEKVVFCVGANRNELRDEGEIVGLRDCDGAKEWSRIFSKCPDNCLLINDKVCVAVGPTFYVLDAETGSVLVEIDSGIDTEIHTTLWMYQGNLVFICADEARILMYTPDGKELLQDIQLPEPFVFQPGNVPVELDGKCYMSVRSNQRPYNLVDYGVFEWVPGESGNVVVESTPEASVSCVSESDTSDSYLVNLQVESLDDLLRFGEIEVKRVAVTYGHSYYSTSLLNKKFNGAITLQIQSSNLTQDLCEEKLSILNQRVVNWANDSCINSGDGEGEIHVGWEFV